MQLYITNDLGEKGGKHTTLFISGTYLSFLSYLYFHLVLFSFLPSPPLPSSPVSEVTADSDWGWNIEGRNLSLWCFFHSLYLLHWAHTERGRDGAPHMAVDTGVRGWMAATCTAGSRLQDGTGPRWMELQSFEEVPDLSWNWGILTE